MPHSEYIAEQGPKLLDALRDVALQLKWVTGAGRTPAQQKALESARQVLEENGQDVRPLD
jgi:hypothetical protein